MTNEEIFNTKAYFNKCLKELAEHEKELVMEMIEEARSAGYREGWHQCMDANGM